jgi:Domain of unknown function (DUF4838)/Glycosyl hydrolase family 67 N-terminus
MNKIYYLIILLAISFLGCKNNELVINERSDYKIVIPSGADSIELIAAKKLQHYLFEMSQTEIIIVEEDAFNNGNGLFLGRTNYAKAQNIDFSQLEEDGYSYKNKDNNFIIAGGSRKGLLYGVYDLLEFLGFRKYTPDYTFIPKKNSILLPKNDTIVVPVFKYRTTSYLWKSSNSEFLDWHKQSSRDDWGLFVHTFKVLMPPQKYYKTHPEYFSLIDGKRLPTTELCLSNKEVFNTVVDELKKRIADNPKPTYWSVSQNDNAKYCQCDNCTELDKIYGGISNQFAQEGKYKHSGSMIWFVNKVAREFPDKIISTLAYRYTREAPDNIKPEENVNIMLCNIESTRENPVSVTDPDFSNDLQNWAKISQNILIWDYITQFVSRNSPFPNLHTIGPNIKLYANNNVRSLFMQSTNQEDELGHLRCYLTCKLMWNPDADPDTIINDFLNGYYGAAAPYIGQYIDTMRLSLLKSDFKLKIQGDPRDARDDYLSVDMMKEYNQLFDKAENAVEKDPQLLQHVQHAGLPLMFAEIEIAKQIEIDKPRSFYMHTSDGLVDAKPEMKKLVSLFEERAKEAGITKIRARSTTLEEYMENFDRIYAKMDELDKTISFKKKIIPISSSIDGPTNLERLTDGVFGCYETWRFPGDLNWLDYIGVHVDFVLDLGEVMPVNSIDMDFLNPQAEPFARRVILPKYVTYATSLDGKKYSDDILITNPHNPDPAENPDIVKIPFYSFSAKLDNRKARYIKVHAESPMKMPSWHVWTGSPSILYTDEIVVK